MRPRIDPRLPRKFYVSRHCYGGRRSGALQRCVCSFLLGGLAVAVVCAERAGALASLNSAGATHTAPSGDFFVLLVRAAHRKLVEIPRVTRYFLALKCRRVESRAEQTTTKGGRL